MSKHSSAMLSIVPDFLLSKLIDFAIRLIRAIRG